MREQLQRRLEELKKEFNAGRARVTELEQQQTTLHQTLFRISGAIQVLEEELKTNQTREESSVGNSTTFDTSQRNGSQDHVSQQA
jgi:predicted nuclease with TOPRIM domain